MKFTDVIFGGESIKAFVHIGGGLDVRKEPQFMNFKNMNRNYPIRDVPDIIDGRRCGIGPKGWMDQTLMPQ